MAQIYESLKALLSPEMTTKAATTLGENYSNVSSAVSSILPSLLGMMIKKGNSSQVKSAFEDAGRTVNVADMSSIFTHMGGEDLRMAGDRFKDAVLGTKSSGFISTIASKFNISTDSASKLTTMVSAVIAGYFGERLLRGQSMTDMHRDLEDEKSKIHGLVPADIAGHLGLEGAHASTSHNSKKGKNNSWIIWVVVIILLIVIFFLWRSCSNKRADQVVNRTNAEQVNSTNERARAQATGMASNTTSNDALEAAKRDTAIMTLPDGQRIVVYREGYEELMLAYLNSDEYKNASAAGVQKHWFHFDNIDFVHDSSTELMPGSMTQVKNIAAILKNYPDAKIKIGGFADKIGARVVNQEISEERAKYIQTLFAQNGVASSRISTEGFGKEFATIPASASDSERAIDRSIAMRFDK